MASEDPSQILKELKEEKVGYFEQKHKIAYLNSTANTSMMIQDSYIEDPLII